MILQLVLQLRAKLILKRMIPLESFFDDVPEWIADKIRDVSLFIGKSLSLKINTTFLVLSWDGMGIERGGVNMIKDKKKEHIVMMIDDYW
jgi:hypothetical protein